MTRAVPIAPFRHRALETIEMVGKPEEAARHATTALGILEGKGDIMLATRVREMFEG